MIEQELFDKIDLAIQSFKQKEGLHKGIKVSKDPHSDWLIFNWRQLSWTENGINYLIEVYPSFDKQDATTGWNLYAAAWYDQDKKRYYVKQHFAENTSLDLIADHAGSLIQKGSLFLSRLKKEQIPFVADLK